MDRKPKEVVRGWVLEALGRMRNSSAPGPDENSYRQMRKVRNTRLGRELVDEIVHELKIGIVPEAWRKMQVIFIPKPGKDLIITKN